MQDAEGLKGKTMNLYEMSNEYLHVLQDLEQMEDGEPTESTIALLQELERDIKNKSDGYCSLIRHYQATEKAIQEEVARLAKRAESAGNRAKWLKTRLHNAIAAIGERQLKTAFNTIAISKNGGKQPVKIDVAPEHLPENLRKVVYQPDVDAIRSSLEAGHEVPGCTLLTRGEHLRLS